MSSVKKNFIYNSIYQIFNLIVPLITTPFLSRVLGAEGIGIYSYAFSIAYYYGLFILLGLNNYGNRAIAKVRDDPDEMSRVFWSIYNLQFVIGIIVCVCYLFYCIVLSNTKLISFSVGLYVLSALFDVNWFFFGIEKFKLTVIRNTVIKIITTVLILVLVKSPDSVLVYSLIMTSGFLLSQLSLWPYVFKYTTFYRPNIKEVIVHLKPNLFLFLTVIACSLFKIMDKIMLGLIANKTQVGFYESAEKIIQVPTALIVSLGTVMLPRMSNLVSNNNKEQSESYIEKSLEFALLISTAMCFGIMGVSKEFVPFFYGKGYDVCVILYLILLPSCLFMAFANVIRTQYLLPHNMDMPYVISAFVGAGINLLINFILIPKMGAVGAAFGTLAAECAVCIVQCYSVRSALSMHKYIINITPYCISGVLMFTVLYIVSLDYKPLYSLVIKIVLGIVVYVVSFLLQLAIFPKRRQMVKSVICSVIRK